MEVTINVLETSLRKTHKAKIEILVGIVDELMKKIKLTA